MDHNILIASQRWWRDDYNVRIRDLRQSFNHSFKQREFYAYAFVGQIKREKWHKFVAASMSYVILYRDAVIVTARFNGVWNELYKTGVFQGAIDALRAAEVYICLTCIKLPCILY